MPTTSTRSWLLLALCLASPLAAQTPPNTLLIVADDVGVDGIGCYGLGSAPPPPLRSSGATPFSPIADTGSAAAPASTPTLGASLHATL